MALTLVTLVLGLGTTAVAASPAHAALCAGYLPVVVNGQVVGWICVPIASERPTLPEPWGISFEVGPADPWWVEGIAMGLEHLNQRAANPRLADQLWLAAQEDFLAAAARLDGAGVRLGTVGQADLERNVLNPDPQPWLEGAGADLVDGVNLMTVALVRPEPDPWLRAAMAQFELAFLQLSQQEVSGR